MSAKVQPQRPHSAITFSVTFLYYRDLAKAVAFYQDIMGFEIAIDQGWSKIYAITGGSHIGLVDEARGSHRSSGSKPVQICLRVPDVDAWYDWVSSNDVAGLRKPKSEESLGIRAFVFDDPEGYQIEIQTPTRPGA